MKANEIIKLIEFTKAFKEPKEVRRRKKLDLDDTPSVTQLLQKRLEEDAILNKFLKDYEKANKKEDKKPDGWSVNEIAMLLLFVTFPPYLALFLLLRH